MARSSPTNAEKAMGANADSRVQQGVDGDHARNKARTAHRKTPPGPDLTGPDGDLAEGKR